MVKPEVLWEITHACNAKCVHCISAAGKNREEELTTDEALNIVDQLSEFSSGIHLLGGEVFLRSDWRKIIERISANGTYFSIVTNGIALTREKIKYLKGLGIGTIGISLDGGSSEVNDYIRGVPGLYNKVLDVINILTEEEMNFTVISTFNAFNIHQVDLMLGTLINSGAKVWQAQTANPHGRMQKDMAITETDFYILGMYMSVLAQKIPKGILHIINGHDFGHFSSTIPVHTVQKEWTGCHAGKYTFGICSNGDIQGCMCMMSLNDYVLGNVREKPIKEYWESADFAKWNKNDEKYKVLSGFCKECEYSYKCQAGCSDKAHSLTGTIGDNPLCYHRIETEWMNKEPQNDFELVFKELTRASIDAMGNVYLPSGNMVNNSLLSTLDLTDHQRKILGYIANV